MQKPIKTPVVYCSLNSLKRHVEALMNKPNYSPIAKAYFVNMGVSLDVYLRIYCRKTHCDYLRARDYYAEIDAVTFDVLQFIPHEFDSFQVPKELKKRTIGDNLE